MKKENLLRIFAHIPELETERLLLRAMRVSDAPDMFEYAKNPDVTEYLLWRPHTDIGYTRSYLEYLGGRYRVGGCYEWAVVHKGERRMIGTCGFTSFDFQNNSAEVGYVLNPAYWHRGIAPEALAEVLHFAFMILGLNRVEAKYMVGNTDSRRVMEKVGMKFEGVARSSMYVKGRYVSIGVCAILRSEYISHTNRDI